MAIENEILPLLEWLQPHLWSSPGALLGFLLRALIVLIFGLFFSYLLCALRHGPSEAFYVVSKVVADAITRDLPNFSLRRTWAVARLAIQEAIRRKVIVAFAVFIVLLLFAGWFLDRQSDNPARLYISFVLNAANFLTLLLTLFLSVFSLPADIKNKTIYTVVTKPVRAGEIVLGRIVGFAAVSTVLVLMTAIVSYGFVVRGLSHTHEINPAEMNRGESSDAESLAATGRTSRNAVHRHEVTIGPDGTGKTDTQMGHWHTVTATRQGNEIRYDVGPHEGMLLARVPKRGKLGFFDREGNPTKSGISVGAEWSYRGYIEGQSKAAAVWKFDGISESQFSAGLPLEMDIRIFRTHKGNIERGVLGEVVILNPNNKANVVRSEARNFTAVEFELGSLFIPRKLKGVDKENKVRDIDLFQDLVHEGQVEIRIRCRESAQYFGMAQADLYLRANDSSFGLNLMKGYFGIWLQMLIITALGVMFSTFLSAPVALLGTIGSVFVGYFGKFIAEVMRGDDGDSPGGGPIESGLRILTQNNLSNPLDIGTVPEAIVKGADWLLMWVMQATATLVPNLADFDTTRYVAYGYSIDANLLLQQTLISLSFVLVVSIIGYFTLKTREIAA